MNTSTKKTEDTVVILRCNYAEDQKITIDSLKELPTNQEMLLGLEPFINKVGYYKLKNGNKTETITILERNDEHIQFIVKTYAYWLGEFGSSVDECEYDYKI